MVDHKQLLARLSDEQRVFLTSVSDDEGLTKLAGHLCALVVTGAWIMFSVPGWQLALVAHGIQLVFLFTLLHETVHFTPFKSRWLNVAAGWVVGFLLVIPPLWFRYFHLAHHRHTNDPENDPELEGKPARSLLEFAWKVTGIPVWGAQLKVLLDNAAGRANYAYLPVNAKSRVRFEALLMLFVYSFVVVTSVLLQSSAFLFLWIIPVLLGQPFLRLYLMAEHGRCPHVANMLENTRTTYTTSLIRWLAWNMPYHVEHHAYPAVPFHKLPAFHDHLKDHANIEAHGYSGFHNETLREFADRT